MDLITAIVMLGVGVFCCTFAPLAVVIESKMRKAINIGRLLLWAVLMVIGVVLVLVSLIHIAVTISTGGV